MQFNENVLHEPLGILSLAQIIFPIAAVVLILLGALTSAAQTETPYFVQRFGVESPVDGLDAPPIVGRPVLVDIDGDGDLDAFAYLFDEPLRFVENMGTPASPKFVLNEEMESPFGLIDGISNNITLSFVDIDGDGDQDAFTTESGIYSEHPNNRYFENVGSPSAPQFIERTGSAHPLNELLPAGVMVLTFGDLDNDTDPDLLAGDFVTNTILHFENTGSASDAVFEQRLEAENPLAGVESEILEYGPILADADHDGDLDVLLAANSFSEDELTIRYFENVGGAEDEQFTERIGDQNGFAGLGSTELEFTTLAVADIDADGDLDGFSSSKLSYGWRVLLRSHVDYFENIGTGSAAHFARRSGEDSPFDAAGVDGRFSSPYFADIDDDGDDDLFVSSFLGTLRYFENVGTGDGPEFVRRTGSESPLRGAGSLTDPGARVFADLDADGDLDVLASVMPSAEIQYYVNEGTASAARFQLASSNPLAGIEGLGYNFALADIDSDGDLDFVSGGGIRPDGDEVDGGYLRYFENIGTPEVPEYLERIEAENPLYAIVIDVDSPPLAFADLDLDGDLDLAFADGGFPLRNNEIQYVENSGTSTVANFEVNLAVGNIFQEMSVGYFNGIAFTDIDGDGDQDFFTGSDAGGVDYFENAEGAPAPYFEVHAGGSGPLPSTFESRSVQPVLADIDGDGDQDLFVTLSGSQGPDGEFFSDNIVYLENTGNPQTPLFVRRTGDANPLGVYQGDDDTTLPVPAFADLNADGDLDVVVTDFQRSKFYFENTGSANEPAFLSIPFESSPLAGLIG